MLSPTSVWNQPLPDDAPIDPQSATYVESLVGTVEAKGAGFSYREYGLGMFWAGGSTPRQKVWVDAPDANRPKLRAALVSVPIPTEFRAPGPFPGDQIAVICAPQPGGAVEYFEFHGLRQIPVDSPAEVAGCSTLDEPGWHCDSACAIKDLRTNPGWFRGEEDWPGGQDEGAKWGCSASRLLLYPHVVTIAEAQRLEVPHALRLTMPNTAHQKTYRWPALASDGLSEVSTTPENGTIFRFAPTETFPDVRNPFVLHCLCIPARDFGIIQTDSGANVSFKGECQDTQYGTEAFRGRDAWKGPTNTFGGPGAILSEAASTLMREFPWSRLQVVDASYRPSSTPRPRLL